MSGKYEKSRFVGVRRTKISFLPRGKIKNLQKSAFPREGKQEISENRLSPARENQKTPLATFPTPQKNEKPRKFDKITFGGQFTFYILSFGIYRPDNCYFLFFFSLEMTLYSEGDMP